MRNGYPARSSHRRALLPRRSRRSIAGLSRGCTATSRRCFATAAAAEEVTAQAFERAYRKRRSFRASRGTEEAWLFGIARNAALDELRRRKRRAVLEADPEDVHATGAAEQADAALRREAVRAALGRLSPRERELVALKFAGGLSNEEIARVVGISASNAGTRLHRTLEKLRRECDEDA